MVILQACPIEGQSLPSAETPQVHQLQVGLIYIKEDSICGHSEDFTSSDESFCLQVQKQCTQANTKISTPHHLITNLEYGFKPHHYRNQYLGARLDSYAVVNIMSASVYKLVFQNPDCKKLAPSRKLKIGTYTTNKVKVVGYCVLYVVHPDRKCLQGVTFYVSCNNGSVLLPCARMLALGLIQPYTRLNYLPPRASLITSSADYPMKTKFQMSMHVSKPDSTVCTESNCQGMNPKLITSTDKNENVSKQQATVSSQQGIQSKLITSTGHNIHISNQEASVSSQQGIVPKLIASDGTKLPKMHMHQITNQSSARRKLCLKSLQPKCKQKPSASFGQEIPVHPWTKLVTDIFHFESASHLLIVDYTSRFPIVRKLSSVKSVHIAN